MYKEAYETGSAGEGRSAAEGHAELSVEWSAQPRKEVKAASRRHHLSCGAHGQLPGC